MDKPCWNTPECDNWGKTTVHHCSRDHDDDARGCWKYVCDDCAFATTSDEMVCPSCWKKEEPKNPKNLECESCNGTGEAIIPPLDPSDWRMGLAPGLPLQEDVVDRFGSEGQYETCPQCKGTGLDTDN